jgi:hypothetical protein
MKNLIFRWDLKSHVLRYAQDMMLRMSNVEFNLH